MQKHVLVLGDLHLRADIFPGYMEKQIETINKIVKSKSFDKIILLGDIFEHRTTKSIVLVKFYEWLESLKQEVIIIRGNHDTCFKSDKTDSILKVFSKVATIVYDRMDYKIHKTVCTFIPHFESESIIKKHLKTTQKVTFGHFGFKNAMSSLGYKTESDIYQAELKGLTFLGHIHKNMSYGKDKRINIVGTPYTTNYGESGQEKFYYELFFNEDGSVDYYKNKVEFGIKHISTSLDGIDKCYKNINPNSYFIFLRIKIDNLDKFKEEELKESLAKKYKFDVLDIKFDDMFEKASSNYSVNTDIFQLNDAILLDYVEKSDTILPREKLLGFLKRIKNDN